MTTLPGAKSRATGSEASARDGLLTHRQPQIAPTDRVVAAVRRLRAKAGVAGAQARG